MANQHQCKNCKFWKEFNTSMGQCICEESEFYNFILSKISEACIEYKEK